MIRIAFYGKGGIGKSTTVSNISVALAQKGLRVLQVGCDPKADSTRLLLAGGDPGTASAQPLLTDCGLESDSTRLLPAGAGQAGLPASDKGKKPGLPRASVSDMIRQIRSGASRTVMDHIRSRAPFTAEDIVKTGYAGVLCAEAGGPLPGQGCAGRAVITALEKIEALGVYERYQPDVVLYDVLGDVVCGGFAMPMRRGYADYVYILTSGENMALYAAANIGLALESFRDRGYAQCAGIILNRRDVPDEDGRVRQLAAELQTEITGSLPRSPLVLEAEEKGQCLLQAFPDSEMAEKYRILAGKIAEKIPGV